jgi:hypothetical protein
VSYLLPRLVLFLQDLERRPEILPTYLVCEFLKKNIDQIRIHKVFIQPIILFVQNTIFEKVTTTEL